MRENSEKMKKKEIKARFNKTKQQALRVRSASLTAPHFTPKVSDTGVLSWTNNGGFRNPDPVNIRGAIGPKGEPGETQMILDFEPAEAVEAEDWVAVSRGGVNTKIPYHIFVEGLKKHTPELTAEQKQAIQELEASYRGILGNFIYTGYSKAKDATRNTYAGDLAQAQRGGKFNINCALLAQLLMMGRSAADFSDLKSYSSQVTKAFDWGYYFAFPHRRVYRAVSALANPAAAVMKNVSYPPDSDYASGSYDAQSWTRATLSLAGDMAFELWALGCEIPFGEVQVGDLAFVSERGWPEKGNLRMSYRNITHVMSCVGISTTADGFRHPIWMDSSVESPIGRHTTGAGFTAAAMALSAQYELHIVMCARHPAAFGLGGNVPDAITEV